MVLSTWSSSLYFSTTGINICTLSRQSGSDCFNSLRGTKWYYNRLLKRCLPFFYRGCGGNDNRFDSEIACRVKCADTCTLPNHYGEVFCFAYFPRWWYNYNTKQCEPFIYGGCYGTRNKFETEKLCYNACDESGCEYIDCRDHPCPYGYKKTKNGCRNKNCECHCPCYEVKLSCAKNKAFGHL